MHFCGVYLYANQHALRWIGGSYEYLVIPHVYHTIVRPFVMTTILILIAGLYIYLLWCNFIGYCEKTEGQVK